MNKYQTLAELFQARQSIPDKGITIIQGETDETFITYLSLYQEALIRLHSLQSRGIKAGDELILRIDDIRDFIVSFWAGILGGFIIIPLAVRAATENFLNLLGILEQLENPYLLTDTDNLGNIETYAQKNGFKETIPRIRSRMFFTHDLYEEEQNRQPGSVHHGSAQSIAFIQYSSGSTGKPKGIVLTHRNILTNINAIIHGIEIQSLRSSLSWMPLTHDMGLIGFHLTPLVAGENHFLLPVSLFARRPLLWLSKASQHKVSVLGSPGFGLKFFLSAYKPGQDYRWDLSSVRLIFNGAEPINYQLCKDFTHALKKYNLNENCMFPVYGLAEAGLAVTFPPVREELQSVMVNANQLSVGNPVEIVEENGLRFVDVGYPIKDCKVRIADQNGNPLAENFLGRIFIKGGNVTSAYYKDQKRTKETITRDGWLNTGDLGFLRNRRLVVTGREKDVVVINGQNYYLHDLERTAEEVKGVKHRKIAVCGIVDPDTSMEEICAFVVHRGNIDRFVALSKRLKDHFARNTGLALKHVIPVDKLPVTTSGKLMRHMLTKKYLDGEFSEELDALGKHLEQTTTPAGRHTLSAIEKKLLPLVRRVLGVNDIGVHDNLAEFGADSLKLQYLGLEVEKLYPGKLRLIDFFDFTTITQVAALIEERKRNNKNDGHRHTLPITLDKRTLVSLEKIADTENVSLHILLISLYIDLLKQMTNQTLITASARIENRALITIHVDVSAVHLFSQLLEATARAMETPQQDEPKDKSSGSLVFTIKENKGERYLFFDYDSRHYNAGKIKYLADSYIRLIDMLIKKY